MRVLLIDNNDSFTHNLKQLVEETGLCALEIMPYHEVSDNILQSFDKFIISPGPGLPSDYPKLEQFVKNFYTRKGILGVCLGLEVIQLAFGGSLIHANTVYHGVCKSTQILKPEHEVFLGIPNPFDAGLYHSWIVDPETIPLESLTVTAQAEDGIVMAMAHKSYNVIGFQFHPESIMTKNGKQLVENWLRINS